jgi:hypothetical protein
MNLTEFANKNKNKIVNIAVLILALLISNNVYKKLSHDSEAIRKKKDTEAKKNEVLVEINIMERKIDSFGKLLTRKDASTAMNAVGNIAKETGIKIVSIKPEPEQKFPDYTKLLFTLIINADGYHSLGKFISRLESSEDVYVIDSIDMRFESGQKSLVVNLKLSTISVAN